MTIMRFDSIGEYVARASAALGYRAEDNESKGAYWDLGVGTADAITRASNGDPSITAKIVDATDRLNLNIGIARRMQAERHFAGGRVDMGAYRTGNPRAMVRRVPREASVQHVGIYVYVSAPASCEASDMLARGCAILGLLETLQGMQVSTDLYLVADACTGRYDREYGPEYQFHQIIRVESKPLDLSTAGFAIAHPAFARMLCFPASRAFEPEVSAGINNPDNRFAAIERNDIGREPGDICIPPLAPRRNNLILTDPSKWIEENIRSIQL